ncbi:MAG: hypothetical protein IPM39_19690 [Chloroflexi bacterium]|nr:hypothetical protein [Chloroflexota bacterium]
MNLNLNIEELVLAGVDKGEETAVLAALEAELTRLFSEAPFSNRQLSIVNRQLPMNITAMPGATPEAIGQQIGRAIYRAAWS